MQAYIDKAAILIEALPYIQRFRNEPIVVKFGGSILEDQDAVLNILKDLTFMECVGLRPVLVHGGGKAITQGLKDKDIPSEFINGQRKTSAEAIKVVEEVLNHRLNPLLCQTIETFSTPATGIHGNSIITVKKHVETDAETGAELDCGFVGDVTSVNVHPIQNCLDAGVIPVVTPLGSDVHGNPYNVNADAAAGAVARELGARKLVFLTDVPGLLADPADSDSLISSLKLDDVRSLIEDGTISGGMLPKIKGAIRALEAGIRKTHIIDANLPHSLLLELFTDKGIGTEILK